MVLSMKRWEGHVAIVTGASAGIGAAIAIQLVEAGLKVVGFARRHEKIEDLAKTLKDKPGKLYAVHVDMTKENEIKKGFDWAIKNIGPISILVNNAGLLTNTTLMNGETELWKKILNTNVLGLSIATREAIKSMQENKIDGHIVHINSILGHAVFSFPSMNMYPASKFAITALTETLRLELLEAKSKIKVSSVSPGSVTTEIIQQSGIDFPIEDINNIPYLSPEDVADSVIYALSTPLHVQIHDIIIKPIGENHAKAGVMDSF